jgi:peptidoglycan-associated lipoprotein
VIIGIFFYPNGMKEDSGDTQPAPASGQQALQENTATVSSAGESPTEEEQAEMERLSSQKEAEQAAEAAKLQQEARRAGEKELFLSEHILFIVDSTTLSPEAEGVLDRKAEWLMANPDVVVILQGYCDERGSETYNLNLGRKRAESAKAYLVANEIPASTFEIVSYGEADPVDPGHDEVAWEKNRRVNVSLK